MSTQSLKESLIVENVGLTLYRFGGTGSKLASGATEVITCQYGDVNGIAYASPSAWDNDQRANFQLEVVSWKTQNIEGKPSMVVTVKNTGTTEVLPAVSILFAMQQ